MKLFYFEKPEEITDYRDLEVLSGKKPLRSLTVNLSRYGYRIITLWAYSEITLKNVSIDIEAPVAANGSVLPASACMALATEGINADGSKFKKNIDITAGALHPILIGLDYLNANIDTYVSNIKIGANQIELRVIVDDTPVFDSEICGPKAMGRVKWLNSTVPGGFNVAKGYEPISMIDGGFAFTGKKVTITGDGLIDNVESYYSESNSLTDSVQKKLFFSPMEFVVEGQKFRYSRPRMESLENAAAIVSDGNSEAFTIRTEAVINYEGRFDYTIKLRANKNIIVPQMALNAYFAACKYNVGLNHEGGLFRPIKWRYNSQWNQDSLFIGDVNCGARIKLKAAGYKMPASGTSYKAQPLVSPNDTWLNYGAGRVEAYKVDEGVVFTATTDRMIITEGKELEFKFEICFTPFHPIRFARAINTRPYQPERQVEGTLDRAYKRMCNYITLTSGGDFLPYANDPFSQDKELKYFISEAHKKDIGVNIQYTPNLISSHLSDSKVLNMLGGDVLYKTPTGKLLVAKLKFNGDDHKREKSDTVIATAPGGRMENYYVEGVKYLTEKFAADGVYIDNLNVSRDTIERTRRVLDEKSGIPAILDAGISNLFNPGCHYANTLNTYTEVLPFVDKLFVKDSYDLKKADRDYILMEVSGIPYGLTSEVACSDNPIMPLVFGMTTRYTSPLDSNKKEKAYYALHRYLDDFGISKAKMFGFWDSTNPTTCDKTDISITTYINGEKMIAIIYNFSDKKQVFDVGINPKKGFTSTKKKIRCAPIAGIQSAKNLNVNSMLTLNAREGVIVEVK